MLLKRPFSASLEQGEPYHIPRILPFPNPSPSGSNNGLRPIDISSESLPVEASLRARLDMWRDAPGGKGEVEGEIELGGFVQWNLEVSFLSSVPSLHHGD